MPINLSPAVQPDATGRQRPPSCPRHGGTRGPDREDWRRWCSLKAKGHSLVRWLRPSSGRPRQPSARGALGSSVRWPARALPPAVVARSLARRNAAWVLV